MEEFNESHMLLEQMYKDQYYPTFLVNKLKHILNVMVSHLVVGDLGKEEVQEKFDEMTISINNLQEEFYENDSEIETVARECIALDVQYILDYFNVHIDIKEALRERDW